MLFPIIHSAMHSCFLFSCDPMFSKSTQLVQNTSPAPRVTAMTQVRPLQKRDQMDKSISRTTLTLALRVDEQNSGIKDTNPWSTRVPPVSPSCTDRVKSTGWSSTGEVFFPSHLFIKRREEPKARISTMFTTECNPLLPRHLQ